MQSLPSSVSSSVHRRRALRLPLATAILASWTAACTCKGPFAASSSFCHVDSGSTKYVSLALAADDTTLSIAPTATVGVTLTLAATDSTPSLLLLPTGSASVTGTLSTNQIKPGDHVSLQLTALQGATPGRTEAYPVEVLHASARDTLTLQVTIATPFTLVAPAAVSVAAGGTVTGSARLLRAPGFAAPVSIAVQGFPTSWTAILPAPATTDTVVPFIIQVPSGTPAGTTTGTLVATFAGTTQQVPLAVNVSSSAPPDFVLTAAPDSIVVTAGQTGNTLVSIARTVGGIGLVRMLISGLPASASATFTPVLADDTTRLAVATTAATPPGRYTLVVTGSTTTLVRSTNVTLVVAPIPALTVAVVPNSLTLTVGSSGSATVTTQTIGNVGPITLDVVNAPAGVTAGITTAPTSQGPVSTLSIAVGANVPPGTYPLIVRAFAGSLVAATSFTLVVDPIAGDFILQLPSATPIVVPFGTTRFVTVHIIRQPAFVGYPLQLSVPTAITGGSAWVAPSIVTADTATLEIIGGSSVGYDITVVGTGGGRTRTASMSIVGAQNFSPEYWIAPTQKEVNAPHGVATPITLLVQRLQGHSDPITFASIDDAPGNWTVTFTPASLAAGSSAPVRVDVTPGAAVPAGPHLLILRALASGGERRALVTVIVP